MVTNNKKTEVNKNMFMPNCSMFSMCLLRLSETEDDLH